MAKVLKCVRKRFYRHQKIPADVYYGIQTARAVENYYLRDAGASHAHTRMGMVKQAAAEANRALGLVDEVRAKAIIEAAKKLPPGNGTIFWSMCSKRARA